MRLESKSVRLRLVDESDAEFIMSLRLDEKYNRYLSKVSTGIDAQRDWIRGYKSDEAIGKQFYFIIERVDGTPCGTVRIYDRRPGSFCWGSWILNSNKTRFAAVESAFLVYEFGFGQLGYAKSHFDVMKENVGVLRFHERMGAVRVAEDELNYYYEITLPAVEQAKKALGEKLA